MRQILARRPPRFTTTQRGIQTGRHHTYEPGPIARGVRAAFVALTPEALRRRIALRMQGRLERVQELERQQQWLRTHGSPLHVMGLHEHAELSEVKLRYRDLVLDTHPDTRAQGMQRQHRRSTTSSGDIVLLRAGAENDYELLQTAYKMAIDPTSLWHQGGGAPALYRELRPRVLDSIVNATTGFALMSYAIGLAAACVVGFLGSRKALEKLIEWSDEDFYNFMLAQEAEEARLRALGAEVDSNPMRYAPEKMHKAYAPGRFVHSDDDDDYL